MTRRGWYVFCGLLVATSWAIGWFVPVGWWQR